MLPLLLSPTRPLRVLAIGAHCDDIEIGAGGTLSRLAMTRPDTRFTAVVFASDPLRESETAACLASLVAPAKVELQAHALPDTCLPAHFEQVKTVLRDLSRQHWDLVFTHHASDAHQDHQLIGALAPTAFRDHLIAQFEIPKWDGDLGRSNANTYVALTTEHMQEKWRIMDEHFVSQRTKDWWSYDTFAALARLRGIECRAPFAEAFRIDKAILAW